MSKEKIYESPDGGKTIYEREAGDYDNMRKKISEWTWFTWSKTRWRGAFGGELNITKWGVENHLW